MAVFSGRVALVTGASRGIGRAIALQLARAGASVVVNYGSRADLAEQVVRAIAESGGEATAVAADMASVEQVQALYARALERFGRLDIVVNNAAIAWFRPILDVTLDEYERTFAVNTRGVFVSLQQAARHLADGGRIVNISSGATVASPIHGGVYCASKAAVEQFSRILARELAPRGITVNTVSPGFTDTDMLSGAGLREVGASMSMLGRLGTPEDIADVVVFLCGHQARWITGQNLQVGGGASIT